MRITGRGGSRAAATSKMECFVIIAAALDPPLKTTYTLHDQLKINGRIFHIFKKKTEG